MLNIRNEKVEKRNNRTRNERERERERERDCEINENEKNNIISKLSEKKEKKTE
jgi:hypothetical protein